jgi:hypothetical protein
MSDLEDDILQILREHKEGLSIQGIQFQLENQPTSPKDPYRVPDWVVSFALDSLRVKELIAKRGFVWSLRR